MKKHFKKTRLSELGEITRGVTYKSPDDLRPAGSPRTVQLLRATNIQDGAITLDDVQVIDEACAPARQRLATGDIAICIANGSRTLVGKAALIDVAQPEDYVVGAFCARFRPRQGESSDLIAAIFESQKYRSWIDRLLGTTTINNLKPSDIADCPIMLPTDESGRRRLGDVLRTSRNLLDQTDALIAAKREQKRGLMQQLLTGKVRFPGFTEPWQMAHLGDFVDLDRGVSYARETDLRTPGSAGCVRLLRATNVQEGQIVLNDVHHIDARRSSACDLLTAGDLVICIANGSKHLVGKHAIATSEVCIEPTVVGAFCARARPRVGVRPAFVAALMESRAYRRWIGSLLAGTNINNLKPSDIASAPLQIPTSCSEIEEITRTYETANREIRILENLREAFATQRRGLMERLLSGEIEVPSTDTCAA